MLLALAIITTIALIGFHPLDWPAGAHPSEIQNPMKTVGAAIAFYLANYIFGRWGSFVFSIVLAFWGLKFISGGGKPFRWTLSFLAAGLLAGWLIRLSASTFEVDIPDYNWGLLSGSAAFALEKYAGFAGAWIISIAALLITAELSVGLKFPRISFGWIGELAQKHRLNRQKARIEKQRRKKEQPLKTKLKKKKKRDRRSVQLDSPIISAEFDDLSLTPQDKRSPETTGSPETYTFPPVELLHPADNGEEVSEEELRASAIALEMRLAEFGVEAKVVDVHPGPVITRFDLQPAPGVKVNRIVALQDDLSLSMRARSLRILAPIPGQAAVGVEVPNSKSRTVRLRSVIESEAYRKSRSKLTIALGVDTAGEPYVANLSDMPHLLVAGTTGSGKSVCLNSILASIIYRARPDEVRFALIDPKKLELSMYIPLVEHFLITPPGVKEAVVTEPESALKLLKSLEIEMHTRINQLSQSGCRTLEEYNLKRVETRIPLLLLVIDELADLMLSAGGAIETPIARLAQMGRAVGIHLIVATQRPSVDVITGVIKANFPCRIAFQVATKVDSRTIIDANGAETLLGKGDMLFTPPGSGRPIRLHCSYITTEEIEAVVEHVSRQPVIEGLTELPDPADEDRRELDLSPGSRDELFEEAARLIALHQQGSVSLLQRKMKIGYARAARIIDQMEAAGIVGPFDGSKARKVLVDETWLPQMGAKGKDEG